MVNKKSGTENRAWVGDIVGKTRDTRQTRHLRDPLPISCFLFPVSRFRHKAVHLSVRRCLVWFVMAVFFPLSAGIADEEERLPLGSAPISTCSDPIDVVSERMSIELRDNSVAFSGDVRATQCDILLTARKLTAYYNDDRSRIERIVASGKVEISQGPRIASGEEALFDNVNRIITLNGDPVLRQGSSIVRGREIMIWLEEDRMEVTGEVNAKLFP